MPQILLDAERQVAAPPRVVRAELRQALERAGFRITAETMTLIEGRRGSALSSALVIQSKLPLTVTVGLTLGEGTCGVAIRLSDRLPSPRTWGMNSLYGRLFTEVQARLDATLVGVDPRLAGQLAQPRFWSATGSVGLLERVNTATSRAGTAAVAAVDQRLAGGPAVRAPRAWQHVSGVNFCVPGAFAALDLGEVHAMLSIAVLLAREPGCMPVNLLDDVERFVARVEEALRLAPAGGVRLDLAGSERAVLEFLDQQVRIRQALPLRTRQVCRTCREATIVNPDFLRLTKRNQRLRNLVGAVGASVGPSGISPFVMLGTALKFANLDPEYVCRRCQGTSAAEQVITFCPRCGDCRAEAVLRTCRRCAHDLRGAAQPGELWQALPVAGRVDPGATLPLRIAAPSGVG